MMRKKDYELIAGIVNYTRSKYLRNNLDVDSLESFAETMATALGARNSKFDRVKFLSGCGIEWVMDNITVVNCKVHGESVCEHCPLNPKDKVLPDENGNCSLCGLHKA